MLGGTKLRTYIIQGKTQPTQPYGRGFHPDPRPKTMKTDLTLLLEELQTLAEALPANSKLLLKANRSGLVCQFLKGGLVRHTVHVRSSALVSALLQVSVCGILEGAGYITFRELFSGFALRVKAKALYEDLRNSEPSQPSVFQQSQVA